MNIVVRLVFAVMVKIKLRIEWLVAQSWYNANSSGLRPVTSQHLDWRALATRTIDFNQFVVLSALQ
jgi:hypothetical protein